MDDEQPLDDSGIEWHHPPPEADDETGGAELDSSAVESAVDDAVPKLPDALFADEEGDAVVHWYVHEDVRVLVMSNRDVDDDRYREVGRSRAVETDDGDWKWEVPRSVVVGRAGDGHADVLGDARFEPGESIHFRASESMLTGETRTCFAMTAAQRDRLPD